jgi:hypothetical protein
MRAVVVQRSFFDSVSQSHREQAIPHHYSCFTAEIDCERMHASVASG